MIRTLFERASRNVVLKRRLPKDFGGYPFFVTPASALQFWRLNTRAYDPFLYDIIDQFVKEGDVVWDVGANIGMFSFASAARGAKVVAFEPDVMTAELIRRSTNLAANQRFDIELFTVGLSDSLDTAKFQIAQRGRSTNYLADAGGTTTTGGVRKTRSIVTVTLDWMYERVDAPNLIKMDIEGAEAMALRSAHTLLAQARPILVCEVLDRTYNEVCCILNKHDYVIYDATASLTSLQPISDLITENILAIPREATTNLSGT